jgi:hypothetical protein
LPAKKATKAIIAYGTETDRKKLKMIADRSHTSGSDWLIRLIREKYQEVFGENNPP